MLEKLAQRIQELAQELDKSAASHNALLGAMTELRNLYTAAVAAAPAVEAVADDAAQVVEAVETV